MTKRFSIASAVLVAFSALLALFLVATPAIAHHNEDHDKGKGHTQSRDNDGDADSEEGTTTEKNDGDPRDATDPNEDGGDNAHPSGNDRSVENGGSGNQGKSESDPDDDGRGPDRTNGGADKPGGPGGVDADDQDGNNGCGNDDDFEDDNEGWCGKKPEEPAPPVVGGSNVDKPTTCPTPMAGAVDGCATDRPDAVLGDELTNEDDEVLGGTIKADTDEGDDVDAAAATRPSSAGAQLPFTGASIVVILVIALGLLGIGAALLRTRRN